MGKTILAIPPQAYRFSAVSGAPGEAELVNVLQSQKNTAPSQIDKIQDVLLDSQGLVQGRYRLTDIGLTQLCKVLAPGLSQALQSLAGMKLRTQDHPLEEYSIDDAIHILNRALQTRFSLLKGKFRFILDRKANQIEGVVGPRYYFFSNLELYQRVKEFLRNKPVSFHEAAISGRRLQLRFKIDAHAFALPVTHDKMEQFHGGWHFANSELGDCCIKGSCTLIRPTDGTVSLAPYSRESKIVHLQGSKFDLKFRDLLEHVNGRVARIPNLQPHLHMLTGTPLNFPVSKEDRDKRFSSLVAAMKKGGIPPWVARDALSRTLIHGGQPMETDDDTLGALAPQMYEEVATRTAFDLYAAMCVLARRFHPEQQETVEQAAYSVLAGLVAL